MAAPAATCPFSIWTSGCSPSPELADLVYSPLVDAKEFPPDVDVTLVEGAVSSEEDLHKIKMIRERTKILVSLGDCAVTANVPGMRNPFGTKAVYDRAYRENVTFDPGVPDQVVPALLPTRVPCTSLSTWMFIFRAARRRPTHLLRCNELLEGRTPDLTLKTRFGS